MAFRMRHWLGVVGVGVAIVLILSLPPASVGRPPFKITRLPEQARAMALRSELLRVNATLRVDRTAATLVPATLASPDGLTVRGTDAVSDSVVPAIRARVRRELAAAGVTTPAVALGLFFAGRPENALPGGSPVFTEYYWGVRDGRAYCFTVLPIWISRAIRHQSRYDQFASLLGPCELIAKYGIPGPTIERWLEGPGEALAATATPFREVDRALLVKQFRTFYEKLPRNSFGRLVDFPGANVSLAREQCWAREGAGCAALIAHPADLGSGTGGRSSLAQYLVQHTAMSTVDRGMGLASPTAHVVADLAHQFGDARFEAFWKADKPFAEAFESAFGTDLASWSLAYFSPMLPAAKAGPDVPLEAELSTVLILALAAILGTVWARRRQVA